VRALRTLASASPGSSDWKYLGARRLALMILASIERGTRWLLFVRNATENWSRAALQVGSFLQGLADEGAFAGRDRGENYFVICDERVNGAQDVASGRVSLLFGIAASRPGEFHACLVTHQAGASRARLVSVNRLATCGKRVEAEIETAIIRLATNRPS
jgi:phage tail sheath protein FI